MQFIFACICNCHIPHFTTYVLVSMTLARLPLLNVNLSGYRKSHDLLLTSYVIRIGFPVTLSLLHSLSYCVSSRGYYVLLLKSIWFQFICRSICTNDETALEFGFLLFLLLLQMQGPEIEFDNELRQISFYSVENGDTIQVKWRWCVHF